MPRERPNSTLIFLFSVVLAFTAGLSGCKKLDLTPKPFIGETSVEVNDVSGAVVARSFLDGFDGEVASPGREIADHGHLWSLNPDPEIPAADLRNPFSDSTSLGAIATEKTVGVINFQSQLHRLMGNATYYVRPYVTFSTGEHRYGKSESFSTGFNTFVDMAFVEGGSRYLGDSLGIGSNDERPAKLIAVDDFAMSRYEVTRAFYDAVMQTGKSGDCPMCPVTAISWIEAKIFARELTRRFNGERVFDLPTEAQWEYAARGGNKESSHYIFSGGNNLEEVGWFLGNSGGVGQPRIREAGLLKPNALGIYDMTGNVIEWCQDWWGLNYYGRREISNPVNGGTGVGTKTRNSKQVGGGQALYYFDPIRSKEMLVGEIGFSDLEAESFFYLDGEIRSFNTLTTVEFFPKVCRSCSYQEPNDADLFCRISNRNPLYAPNEQDEKVGFRIVEILK